MVDRVPDYDLGMMRVFVLVYETGSVTAAAEQLYISQPSVSYTLRKVRNLFGDPLFVRHGQRLQPTPVADELYPRLRRLLESIDDVMTQASTFDPATSTRRFRLRMTDVGVSGLLPRVMQRLRQEAPGVVLEVETLNLDTVVHELRAGQADAAISTKRLEAPDLERDRLFTQAYVGVCAADHDFPDEPTLAQYEAGEHVTVAASTGHSAVDQLTRETGIRRHVVLVIPNFSALPSLLQGTDLLCFAPTNVARRWEAMGQVRTFALPFDIPITEIALYTVRRELPSAEFEWFRRSVREALHT